MLNNCLLKSDKIAWEDIFSSLLDKFSLPYGAKYTAKELVKREKEIIELENILSGAAWTLWNSFEKSVPRTTQMLISFWQEQQAGKAILILDGLSIREMPLLLQESSNRGFKIKQVKLTGSELPSETTIFAKGLGFSQRSALANNQTGPNHLFPNAKTDCVNLPWLDCLPLINAEPNWILWHTWPDELIHDLSGPGAGIHELAVKVEQNIRSEDFWKLVERLTTGRRLIITSDHGYASTGEFTNVDNKEQSEYLKSLFKNQRYAKSEAAESNWVPPTDICIQSVHGSYRYVLGRRKWKSSGGYPTLTHGGLSLMETIVPYIEVQRN